MNCKRNMSLQGIRGLAILCIMMSHSKLIVDSSGNGMLSCLGGLGVEFFIILSGYLTCYWHLNSANDNAVKPFRYAISKIKKYYDILIKCSFD